ncbi:histidine kinase [Nostoc favosum]|uniref:Histidine kinase n=1 Tax=Nostoc favosum CHAB5714 TaxID=2780399 RepID=A0ABS8I3W4_9NOSO|nr:histidine kinase [Nostoc favosum]MCC5598304.1 histidine kinase [Nostoc favosum CHAB5714]
MREWEERGRGQGENKNYLFTLCVLTMPNAQCPMPNAPCPMPNE